MIPKSVQRFLEQIMLKQENEIEMTIRRNVIPI